ncbi:MAG: heme-binding protein [Bacilli bacterium]|nr:heme-binding protein [Bacilli bacterium]
MALIETIKYEVIQKTGKIEIRRYDEFILASTRTSKDQTSSSGFSNVFNYISGNNRENTKISMTTPVVTYEDDNRLVTGFYVPSKFDKDKVPHPTSEKVFIETYQPSLYAVIKFSGGWEEKHLERFDETLKTFINQEGFIITSPRLLFRYQPPFVPGVFRRNELAYQIQKNQ